MTSKEIHNKQDQAVSFLLSFLKSLFLFVIVLYKYIIIHNGVSKVQKNDKMVGWIVN